MSFEAGAQGSTEQDYRNILRAINALPGTLGERIHGAGLVAAARVVRDYAKANAGFVDRSGRLRSSIRARRRSQKVFTLSPNKGSRRIPGAAAQVVVGGRGARQAYIIEFGREPGPGYPGSRAFPILLPAATSTRGQQLTVAIAAMRRNFAQTTREIQSGRPRPVTLRHLAADEVN